jgi:succinate dehydrogenase / fumarate reductase cytochrome b subunit
MQLTRKVGFFEGLKYKGGLPMVAWLLHRISGLGILALVGLHVLAAFLTQQMGSDLGIAFNVVYESHYFQLFVVFCVLYHAINGFRIAVLDIWPKYLQYEREALWVQFAVFLPVYGLTAFQIFMKILSGS